LINEPNEIALAAKRGRDGVDGRASAWHVLILEITATGHHPSYIRWLLESDFAKSSEIILAARREMFEHPEILACQSKFTHYQISVSRELEVRLSDFSSVGLMRMSWTIGRLYREVCASLARTHRVIKAVQVRRGFRPASLSRFRHADGILLDGFARGLHGGTGRALDWNLARAARRYGRIILAGGLTPENIAEAIRVAEPYAVDVASGVEARPGRKDPARLRALFAAVESARE